MQKKFSITRKSSMLRSKNKLLVFSLSWFLSGCSSLSEFCPFGGDDENDSMAIVVYSMPVVVDLDYQNIPGSQDTVIIKGAYQHALTLAGTVHPDYPSAQQIGTASIGLIDRPAPLRETIHFDFNQSSISMGERYKLDEFIEKIDPKTLDHILVEGHTDAKGTLRYNNNLSIRRAKTVRDYLVQMGIEKQKISIEGFGETAPETSNRSESERAMNRRAVIIPTKKYSP